MKACVVAVFVAASLFAQDKGQPMPEAPRLPVTREKLWNAARWRIHERVALYDTWQVDGKQIATVDPETVVEGLGKLSVVHQPDVIRMTKDMPEAGLRVGDTVLRYTYLGEGFADVWFDGRWYPEYDSSFVKELDGSGCGNDNCHAVVEKAARKEWWAHVRLTDGREGWMRIWGGLWWRSQGELNAYERMAIDGAEGGAGGSGGVDGTGGGVAVRGGLALGRGRVCVRLRGVLRGGDGVCADLAEDGGLVL